MQLSSSVAASVAKDLVVAWEVDLVRMAGAIGGKTFPHSAVEVARQGLVTRAVVVEVVPGIADLEPEVANEVYW